MSTLASLHTLNFPGLLHQLGISLVLSSSPDQSVILVRSDGQVLNTHFCAFDQPLALAAAGARLAVSTPRQIHEFSQSPPPPGPNDFQYTLRQTWDTRDTVIREMAYGRDGLWFVDSQFSYLGTLKEQGLEPWWRPAEPWTITGLGMRSGVPRYITAEGMVWDLAASQSVCSSLAAPCTPRWHNQQLWVLEAGADCCYLTKVEDTSGQANRVARLPGLPRGLDFWGPFALIGLSRPPAGHSPSGVWVVDTQTGQEVAFLQFKVLGEISSLVVLPGVLYPDLSYQSQPSPPPLPVTLSPPSPRPPVSSLAVIVPVYNICRRGENEAVLVRTLESIEASLRYFEQHYPGAEHCSAEVVLVDDTTTDKAWATLQRLTRGKPWYRLVRHATNRGQSAARNTGVRSCQAQALFFCDDDDRYFPTHTYYGMLALNQPLPEHFPSSRLVMGGGYPGVVRSRARFSVPIHPEWVKMLSRILPITLVIRREAYEFIGGFPEQEAFRKSFYGQEDWALSEWIGHFCVPGILEEETVEHFAYPGNAFHHQIEKFQYPPGRYPYGDYDRLPDPEQQQEYTRQIGQIVRDHLQVLEGKYRQRRVSEHLHYLGSQAMAQGNYPLAVSFYQQCLQLAPDYPLGHYHLGMAHMKGENWLSAQAAFEQAIAVHPTHPEAHHNLGWVHHAQKDLKSAALHYRQALALSPDLASSHLNLGLALLVQGDWPAGWGEYEWRTRAGRVPPVHSLQPRWDGGKQPGKTLLLYTEQGFGDAIQFVRYVPLVREVSDCGALVLVCQPELRDLFALVPGVDHLLPPGEVPSNTFDLLASLLSLPHLVGTTLATIPSPNPYLRVPEGQTFGALPPPLGGTLGGLRLGLVWAGSPENPENLRRSCRLTDFSPLFRQPGVSFYSLQKPVTPREQELLKQFQVQDLSARLTTFAETAAAIAQLDLVLGVDTAVVHLAGALGKPTWTLLSYAPDWRWFLDRDDSPWYPTMRLFRQSRPGDWGELVGRVGQALSRLSRQGGE